MSNILRKRGLGKIKVIQRRQALKELGELGRINDTDIRVSLIQALIPVGLEKVNELLKDEVSRLAGEPRKHGKINTRWSRQGGAPSHSCLPQPGGHGKAWPNTGIGEQRENGSPIQTQVRRLTHDRCAGGRTHEPDVHGERNGRFVAHTRIHCQAGVFSCYSYQATPLCKQSPRVRFHGWQKGSGGLRHVGATRILSGVCSIFAGRSSGGRCQRSP